MKATTHTMPGGVVPRQMGRAERIAFAAGDIFGGGGSALLNILYFVFLTDVVGLRPSLAGAVVAAGKVWDGIIKPVMGQLTDNTRTKWGRRRPYMFAGSFLILVSYALLWLPSGGGATQTGKAVFALAGVLFYVTVAALVTVPYTSMSTETTTDPTERSSINLVRLAFASSAGAIIVVVATGLMQLYKHGSLSGAALYGVVAGGFGVLFFIPVLLASVLGRERTPIPADKSHFSWRRFVSGLQVAEFRSLLGMYLCQGLAMDVIGFLVIAYSSYVVKVSTPLFMGILILTNLIGVALCNTRFKHLPKGVIYGTLIPVGILGMAAIALWPGGWPVWPIYLFVVVLAAGVSGCQLMSWVMFPDVVDAAELRLGERLSGSLTGLMVLCRSLCTATLMWLVGVLLEACGYVGKSGGQSALSQPGSAVWAIRWILLGAVVIFGTLGWALARRYPLTPQVVAANSTHLATVRGEGVTHE